MSRGSIALLRGGASRLTPPVRGVYNTLAMPTDELSTELTDQDRLLLVLGYLGPLAIFSLLATRRQFVKWHARQGLVLSAAVAALYLAILRPLYLVIRRFVSPLLGELFWTVIGLVLLGAIVTMALCIARALEGERFKIPMLGDLVDRM